MVDEGLDVVLCFIVQVFVVHIDGVERVVEEVADEGGGAVEFAGDFAGCLCGGEAIGQGAPVVGELLDVYLEFFGGAALSEGAHDDAEVLGFQSSGDLAEPFAFSAPFDFLGEEHFVAVGDEHAVAAGEGDTRSDAWPFGGNALFGNLYEDGLPCSEHIRNIADFFNGGLAGDRGEASFASRSHILDEFVESECVGADVQIV